MANKTKNRAAQESAEQLETQELKVPSSRFQDKQRLPEAASAIDASAGSSSFSATKQEKKGSVLKQDVAAEVVTTGVGGGLPGEVTGTYSLSYGGNEGTILGSAAYTPSVGQSRSDSRVGKKLDATVKKINFVASEQVLQEVEESAPLAKNPDAVQGYNGTYRNENARMQKNNGGVPGELLYQRSIDEIKRDQLYFSTGQHVDTEGVVAYDTPTYVPESSKFGVLQYPDGPNYDLKRGNFLHRELRFKFSDAGQLEKFYFVTDDVSTTVSSAIADKSSVNATLDRNHAEMNRQIMDAKAGDEKAELWTPLARAVKEPTQTVAYLRDIENITGSEVFMAYKKTALCHSYQLNRAAKDGLKTFSPMVEALIGLNIPEKSSALSAAIVDPFDVANTTDGNKIYASAANMISAFDSTTKYKTKGDVLTMPRSFKMHLQTADNNMNPLRVKADFVRSVNNREVFSTIDRDYDPLMPVCISDRAALIHCYDFNDLYAWESLKNGARQFKKNPFTYMYSDLRNNYVVEAAIPLLEGIADYLTANAAAFKKIYGTKEVIVSMQHSTCFFSFWSLLVLAATPFILNNRVNSLRDVLYYEKNVEYPFDQLISIKDANPMNAVNYTNDDYLQPIKTKQMMPSVRATWVMPELFWPFDENTDNSYAYVLPWYFNQEEFDFTSVTASYSGVKCAMSMPSIRSGAKFAYLDDVYSMSERDLRLCLDRLTDIPVITTGTGKSGVYKYGQNTDGIPFVTLSEDNFTIGSFISLPREQGYFMVAPYGTLSVLFTLPVADGHFNFSGLLTTPVLSNSRVPMHGESSYMLKFWHGKGIKTVDASGSAQAILDPVQINVNRNTAYVQDWDSYHATLSDNAEAIIDFGWVPSINLLYGKGNTEEIFGRSAFIPFTNGVKSQGREAVYTDKSVYMVGSLQKALWTRIQMLPMALSPFDFCAAFRAAGEDAIKYDPYDFLYYFGLAGFRASDYREDVYNRSADMVNLGFTFLKDSFVEDSPVFKESLSYTQSKNDDSIVS